MKIPGIFHKLASSRRNRAFVVGITALVASLIYLIAGNSWAEPGYPLDDAWIHQTYARNLVQNGEWSFIPGQVSGGSTSPLWTLILSIGQALGIPGFWTYAAGIILSAATAMVGVEIIIKAGANPLTSLFFGLFLATEWHLVWASVSGMETILLVLVILLFFFFLFDTRYPWAVGLLIGIAIWIRPDSISLVGPWLWVFIFTRPKRQNEWKSLITGGLLLLMLTGLYLVFNYFLTGNIIPNTFYAKQAEYASMLEAPILARYFRLFWLPWIGASVLLLPGLAVSIIVFLKTKRYACCAPILWALGYVAIFAARLPVTYQHGRYIMPAMPVFFLAGFWGVQKAIRFFGNSSAWRRILRASWITSIIAAQVGFLFLGARSFANDVAFINMEMVTTAQWIRDNTEKDAVIAAHDIGAIGYFSEREIIDLAGLVTPEVIPFIRDELKIADYITSKDADYLVIFPGWYPALAEGANPVYYSDAEYSPELGGENMHVYRWLP